MLPGSLDSAVLFPGRHPKTDLFPCTPPPVRHFSMNYYPDDLLPDNLSADAAVPGNLPPNSLLSVIYQNVLLPAIMLQDNFIPPGILITGAFVPVSMPPNALFPGKL